jgi:ribosome-binding protein aMBF1 (putative translation factor)
MQSENKTKEVVSKLQEIIHLCRQEGALSNEEMREVVKVENEVLNYLQRTTG